MENVPLLANLTSRRNNSSVVRSIKTVSSALCTSRQLLCNYCTTETEFLRNCYIFFYTAECFAHISHRLGICLYIRLSVTLRYCVKTTQARITRSTLQAAARTLVYRDNFMPVGAGVPLKLRHQRGIPPKSVVFISAIMYLQTYDI